MRLAAGAAAAPGIATLAAACGPRGKAPTAARRRERGNLRQRLRELVDELEEVYPVATALVITGATGAAAADDFERGAHLGGVELVRFEVFDGASWFSQTIASTDLDVLASTAARLRIRAPSGRGGERLTRNASPRDFARRGEIEVRGLSSASGTAEWVDRASAMFALSHQPTSSRIIYRGAFVEVSDLERLFVGAGQDLRQSISRVRAGVVLLSWSGSELVAEEAARAGTGGLELAALDADRLADAARRALSLSAEPPAQIPDTDVVLAPSVVAPLMVRGVAELLDGRSWQTSESALSDFASDQIGDSLVSLLDDPTAEGGYASYDFDDEGWLASRRPLLRGGVVEGPYTDRRTAGALSRPRTGHGRLTSRGIAPRPSNLIMEHGSASESDLVGAVKRGYLIDGGLVARCDPLRLRVLVRARQAREIVDGSLSGRVMGPVTVSGDLKGLLLAVRALGRARETHTFADGVAATTPHLLTRAEVG